MNRNSTKELYSLIAKENNVNNIEKFFAEMFTKTELETLLKRWQIIKLLNEGKTQRHIARELKVSLCKVTRGSQILKNKDSIVAKYLGKDKK